MISSCKKYAHYKIYKQVNEVYSDVREESSYNNSDAILMQGERMSLMKNKLVVLPSLPTICCVVQTNSSNRVGMSHSMKLVNIFHLFLTLLSMKLTPFISSTEKCLQGVFHTFYWWTQKTPNGCCIVFLKIFESKQ